MTEPIEVTLASCSSSLSSDTGTSTADDGDAGRADTDVKENSPPEANDNAKNDSTNGGNESEDMQLEDDEEDAGSRLQERDDAEEDMQLEEGEDDEEKRLKGSSGEGNASPTERDENENSFTEEPCEYSRNSQEEDNKENVIEEENEETTEDEKRPQVKQNDVDDAAPQTNDEDSRAASEGQSEDSALGEHENSVDGEGEKEEEREKEDAVKPTAAPKLVDSPDEESRSSGSRSSSPSSPSSPSSSSESELPVKSSTSTSNSSFNSELINLPLPADKYPGKDDGEKPEKSISEVKAKESPKSPKLVNGPTLPPVPEVEVVSTRKTLLPQVDHNVYQYFTDSKGDVYSVDREDCWYIQHPNGEYVVIDGASPQCLPSVLFPLNPDGQPTLPLNANGERSFPLDSSRLPVFPVDPATRLPTFPLDDTGHPVFPTGIHGRPIVPLDHNGLAIFPRDSSGRFIFPLGANGKPVAPVNICGVPVLPLNAKGKPVVPYDSTGAPLIHLSSDGITPLTEEEYLYSLQWNSYYDRCNQFYGHGEDNTSTVNSAVVAEEPTFEQRAKDLKLLRKVRPEDIDLPPCDPPPPSAMPASTPVELVPVPVEEPPSSKAVADAALKAKTKRLIEMQLRFSRKANLKTAASSKSSDAEGGSAGDDAAPNETAEIAGPPSNTQLATTPQRSVSDIALPEPTQVSGENDVDAQPKGSSEKSASPGPEGEENGDADMDRIDEDALSTRSESSEQPPEAAPPDVDVSVNADVRPQSRRSSERSSEANRSTHSSPRQKSPRRMRRSLSREERERRARRDATSHRRDRDDDRERDRDRDRPPYRDYGRRRRSESRSPGRNSPRAAPPSRSHHRSPPPVRRVYERGSRVRSPSRERYESPPSRRRAHRRRSSSSRERSLRVDRWSTRRNGVSRWDRSPPSSRRAIEPAYRIRSRSRDRDRDRDRSPSSPRRRSSRSHREERSHERSPRRAKDDFESPRSAEASRGESAPRSERRSSRSAAPVDVERSSEAKDAPPQSPRETFEEGESAPREEEKLESDERAAKAKKRKESSKKKKKKKKSKRRSSSRRSKESSTSGPMDVSMEASDKTEEDSQNAELSEEAEFDTYGPLPPRGSSDAAEKPSSDKEESDLPKKKHSKKKKKSKRKKKEKAAAATDKEMLEEGEIAGSIPDSAATETPASNQLSSFTYADASTGLNISFIGPKWEGESKAEAAEDDRTNEWNTGERHKMSNDFIFETQTTPIVTYSSNPGMVESFVKLKKKQCSSADPMEEEAPAKTHKEIQNLVAYDDSGDDDAQETSARGKRSDDSDASLDRSPKRGAAEVSNETEAQQESEKRATSSESRKGRRERKKQKRERRASKRSRAARDRSASLDDAEVDASPPEKRERQEEATILLSTLEESREKSETTKEGTNDTTARQQDAVDVDEVRTPKAAEVSVAAGEDAQSTEAVTVGEEVVESAPTPKVDLNGTSDANGAEKRSAVNVSEPASGLAEAGTSTNCEQGEEDAKVKRELLKRRREQDEEEELSRLRYEALRSKTRRLMNDLRAERRRLKRERLRWTFAIRRARGNADESCVDEILLADSSESADSDSDQDVLVGIHKGKLAVKRARALAGGSGNDPAWKYSRSQQGAAGNGGYLEDLGNEACSASPEGNARGHPEVGDCAQTDLIAELQSRIGGSNAGALQLLEQLKRCLSSANRGVNIHLNPDVIGKKS